MKFENMPEDYDPELLTMGQQIHLQSLTHLSSQMSAEALRRALIYVSFKQYQTINAARDFYKSQNFRGM